MSLVASEQEIASIVAALKSARDLHRGRAIHAQLLQQINRHSAKGTLILANSLIDMYARCGSMADARDVFDRVRNRGSIVSWNTIIGGYARNGQGEIALEMFSAMAQEHLINPRTFVAALEAIKDLASREAGAKMESQGQALIVKAVSLERAMALHTKIAMAGLESNAFVANSLLDCYARCGSMLDSQRLFDRLLLHDLDDVVSWNSIILACVHNNSAEFALELFDRMGDRGSPVPTVRTFVAVLTACASLAGKSGVRSSRFLEMGASIHAQILASSDAAHDEFLHNSLMDLYIKSGSLDRARLVFDAMKRRTVVSWNVIILGFAEAGDSPQVSIELFDEMRIRGFDPDAATFVAVIKACSKGGFLDPGKRIHLLIARAGMESDSAVACSLIGLYGRCGNLLAAELAFQASSCLDMATWSALIGACSHHGSTQELAFRFFRQMLEESIRPDEITLLSLLTSCSRSGLVDRVKKLFQEMEEKFAISPRMEHYACLVDLLSRAGRIEEAMAAIDQMPRDVKPSLEIWMAVLSACQTWKNAAVARRAFDAIVEMDERRREDEGSVAAAYAMMANIFSQSQPPERR